MTGPTVTPPPPARILFVASAHLGYVVPPLAWVRANLRRVDTLVVRKAPHGPERAAAAIATSIGAAVEWTRDPVTAVAGVDGYVIAIRDLDEVPCQALWAADRAGLTGVYRAEGAPPTGPLAMAGVGG